MLGEKNWRKESGMFSEIVYEKKFSFYPIKCVDGSIVFIKNYYKKYIIWTSSKIEGGYFHKEYIESITEDEYIIRKLAEKL